MSASAEAHDGLPPASALGKTTRSLRAAIAEPTRGPAARSLTVAVRDRKVEGNTQSLAAAVPSGLHPHLLTENLLSDRMTSGDANVMTTPGSSPLCPRRSTPPPYRKRTQSFHFIAPSVSRTDLERAATTLGGADTLAEPFAGKPQQCIQPSTIFEEYLSRAQPSSFEEYLWPFPPAELPELSHLDAIPDIFDDDDESH